MARRYRKLQWVFVLILIAALGAAVIIGSAQRSSVHCIARAVGTNVSGVSVRVTRGPTHTFYYPSRLHWEWDRACKGLGLPIESNSWAITNSPTPASDVLWVTITYRGGLSVVSPLVAEEVDDGDRIHALSVAYGLLDPRRRTTVSRCPLVGGAERYRGRTIRIRATSLGRELAPGRELATIKFR